MIDDYFIVLTVEDICGKYDEEYTCFGLREIEHKEESYERGIDKLVRLFFETGRWNDKIIHTQIRDFEKVAFGKLGKKHLAYCDMGKLW